MNDLDLLRLDADATLHRLGRPEIGRVTVGAIVTRGTEKGVQVLLLRRRDSGDYAGIEELPSGQVEAGESLFTALRREVAEETGLLVRRVEGFAFDFEYQSRRGPTIQLTYAVSVAGDPHIKLDQTEHADWRWVDEADIGDTDLTANVLRGVRAYLAAARP